MEKSRVLWIYAISLMFNVWILHLRRKRKGFVVESARIFLSGFAVNIEKISVRVMDTLADWLLPAGFRQKEAGLPPNLPITTEFRTHSLLQISLPYRGSFYLVMVWGFLTWILMLQMPDTWLQALGPIAVLQVGICLLIVALQAMNYLNHVYLFPLFLFLGIWVLFSSAVNEDHPLRQGKRILSSGESKAITLDKHLDHWIQTRFWATADNEHVRDRVPVYLVCAEGGANRSGYWTALMLQTLREKLGPSFDENLFSISSVSGGSFGTLAYCLCRNRDLNPDTSRAFISAFFRTVYLSPLTNHLLAGESIQLLLPWYEKGLDRAIAFENAVGNSIRKNLPSAAPGGFFKEFQPKAGHQFAPLILIHSTEVESGKRSILTNQPLSDETFTHYLNLNSLIKTDLELETVMHLSARFPVFSPSASLEGPDGRRHHFVDGGYYDRGGYETTLELVRFLNTSKWRNRIRPVVVVLSNSLETGSSVIANEDLPVGSPFRKPGAGRTGVSFLNEPLSILYPLTLGGQNNTLAHKEELKKYLKEFSGEGPHFLEFDLKASPTEVPMNWFLSGTAMRRMERKAQNLKTSIPDLTRKTKKEPEFTDSIPKPSLPLISSSGEKPKSGISTKSGPQQEITHITHPHLFYYSRKKKMWRRKSEADFNLQKIKPLGKRFGRKNNSKNSSKNPGNTRNRKS